MATWSISPASQSFTESAGFVTFTVTRSASGTAQTVFLSTLQNQGSTNSSDYVGKINESVSFSATDLSKTVTLQILDDTTHENNETFGLLLEGPVGTTLASTTFTITDNDPVAATWSISPASQSFAENGGFVTFTVTRSASGTAQTVFLSTLQNQGSTNSSDYVGKVNESISFSATDLSKTVTLQILDDATHENNETFGLLLEGPVGMTLASTTFTISDNDPGGAATQVRLGLM